MPFWLHYGQDALNEYKLVKKEAVFNYYKLLRNIMDDILVNNEHHSFSRDTIREMIRISFTDYCSQIREYSTALTNYDLVRFVTTIEKKIDYDELVKQVIARNEEKRKRSRGRMSRKRLANEEAEEIDEFICNDCKSFVNFQWVEIDVLQELEKEELSKNRKSTNKNTDSNADASDTSIQLPTPNQSPKASHSGFPDIESEWTQIVKEAQLEGSSIANSAAKVKQEIINESQQSTDVPTVTSVANAISTAATSTGSNSPSGAARSSKRKHNNAEISDKAKPTTNSTKTAVVNDSPASRLRRKSRRLASKEGDIEVVHVGGFTEDDDIQILDAREMSLQETKTRMLQRMKRKRMKNGNFGKVVLCMECLSKKISTLKEKAMANSFLKLEPKSNLNGEDEEWWTDEVKRLHGASTLYQEVDLKDLETYICVDIQPKVIEMLKANYIVNNTNNTTANSNNSNATRHQQ
ncbi:unnamed protein product [Ambrosiozyma monospora]|uniref:Unnamed protein product n=1 Tax=Ambrosiozyma monospora TaxID=43982 RepID=A0A9W7DIH9_AMBMO|nr:unnamed protein product [Ambrosiozyma monospora]